MWYSSNYSNWLRFAYRTLRSTAFSRTYRGQALKHLEENAPHLIIPFLELLIFGRPDQDIDSEDEDEEDQYVTTVNSSERWGHQEPGSLGSERVCCNYARISFRERLALVPMCKLKCYFISSCPVEFVSL